MISLDALSTPLSASYAVRVSSSFPPTPPPTATSTDASLTDSPSLPYPHAHTSASRPTSASRRSSHSHRSSLGQPLSTSKLRLTSSTRRVLTAHSQLHSPAGSELSLAPSLLSSPLPCSPASQQPSSRLGAVGQENVHPNVEAALSAGLEALELRGGGKNERAVRTLLSPSLDTLKATSFAAAASSRRSSSLSIVSTPLSAVPTKRLSFSSEASLSVTRTPATAPVGVSPASGAQQPRVRPTPHSNVLRKMR